MDLVTSGQCLGNHQLLGKNVYSPTGLQKAAEVCWQ